ncbi:MAG: pilus assembly PilX family protein [Gemmatimonadales bacterium]
MTKHVDGNGGRGPGRKREAGFALVVAILALMLLTFLGLALAATTSTELQIATNYRWSQQALYNAEAGLQVGKLLLMNIVPDWGLILPVSRGGTWTEAAPAGPPTALRARNDAGGQPTRNFSYGFCDNRYARAGFGVVFDDPATAAPYQNVTTILGQTLNGSFTLWVRRPVVTDAAGNIGDYPQPDQLILTAEGTAPYTGALAGFAFARANKAVRVLEITLTSANPQECGGGTGQRGLGSGGAGFNPCVPLAGGGTGPGGDFGNLGGRLTGRANAGTGNQGGQALIR